MVYVCRLWKLVAWLPVSRVLRGIEMAESTDDFLTATDAHVHHDTHVRRISAGNPNTPEQILSRLSEDRTHNVRYRVAENPRTPADVLARLAKDSHSDIRIAVAENPSTPADLLTMLASDHSADVRYGVAENPHMPEAILLKLADDENPYVRCRAMKTVLSMAPEVQERVHARLSTSHHSMPRAANE